MKNNKTLEFELRSNLYARLNSMFDFKFDLICELDRKYNLDLRQEIFIEFDDELTWNEINII